MRTTIRIVGARACLLAVLAASSAQAETFDCVITPTQVVKVGSAVTGVLASVLVDRGDTVTAGQTIARLDSSVEEANMILARAQASSNEAVDAQKARLDLARKKLQRAAPLADKYIVTQDKLEGLQADYVIAQSDLQLELLKHHLAEIEVRRAQAALDLRFIKSPFDGLVVDKHLSAGEFVNQEAYVLTLAQLDPLHVEAYIPVADYGKIETGSTGIVHPAEPIGGSYKAPVTVVDHVFDAASGTFSVRLTLPNPGNNLPGGERCRVDFDLTLPPKKIDLGPQASLDPPVKPVGPARHINAPMGRMVNP